MPWHRQSRGSFLNYIKISHWDNANKLVNHPNCYVMLRFVIIIFCSLCTLPCFSQLDTTCLSRRSLPEAVVKATIKGYSFARELDVKLNSLKKNFSLTLSDNSYEIVGFEFYYNSEEGDIHHRTVCGENVLIANYSLFNNLKNGGLFEFTNITIEKAGIKYHVPDFLVFPVD